MVQFVSLSTGPSFGIIASLPRGRERARRPKRKACCYKILVLFSSSHPSKRRKKKRKRKSAKPGPKQQESQRPIPSNRSRAINFSSVSFDQNLFQQNSCVANARGGPIRQTPSKRYRQGNFQFLSFLPNKKQNQTKCDREIRGYLRNNPDSCAGRKKLTFGFSQKKICVKEVSS